MEEKLNKYGEKWCILPTCGGLAGHDGYYCEEHHEKYYFGKVNSSQLLSKYSDMEKEEFCLKCGLDKKEIKKGGLKCFLYGKSMGRHLFK